MKRSLAFASCIVLFVLGSNVHLFAQKKEQITPGGVFTEPKRYVPNPETNETKSGKLLFETNNCASCHSAEGRGGCLAPLLDGVGSRRNKEFILARITDSPNLIEEFQKLHGPELMPHVRVAPADANLIAAYLLTLPEPKDGGISH